MYPAGGSRNRIYNRARFVVGWESALFKENGVRGLLFNSVHFLLFFVVAVFVYFLIPLRVRWVWLLVASYYFYMSWNPRYALLMAVSTVITFLSGVLIHRAGDNKGRKKLWVALSFGANLAILFFFKYFHFAVDSLNMVLAQIGVTVLDPTFDVLLPVGISFYTFQALSYTVDVYRGQQPEKNLFKYALFVSFFPQLVAGPIERTGNLLAQIHNPKPFDFDRAKNGLWLMLWGYFEKLVIADRAALLVDQVYNNYAEYGSVPLVIATLLFAVQIYCDFCGYSDIAIGAAQVMGFSLRENFHRPYFATSIADFWRRWHISLSTWFRDYLYIPLGGSRCGRLKKYRNVMITFLASGLWHGASWTYVVWGFLHGAFQIAGDALKPLRQRVLGFFHVKTDAFSHRVLRTVFTFGLVCFCWIFFRASSVGAAWQIVRQILVGSRMLGFADMGLNAANFAVLGVAVLVLLCVSLLREKLPLRTALARQNLWFRWGVLLCGIFAVLIFGVYGPGFDAAQFIYFQF